MTLAVHNIKDVFSSAQYYIIIHIYQLRRSYFDLFEINPWK